MNQETLKQWASDESKKIKDERTAKMKEKGYREFYPWRKGENRFEVVPTEDVREIEGKFGKQKIFVCKAKGEIFDMAVNVRSPVYRILVNGLANGQVKFNIQKSGEGKDTRYEELSYEE